MKITKGNNIGDEGAQMISESLKINTTLTELYLNCDDKIIKKENSNRKKEDANEIDNEQVTKLEQKELR